MNQQSHFGEQQTDHHHHQHQQQHQQLHLPHTAPLAAARPASVPPPRAAGKQQQISEHVLYVVFVFVMSIYCLSYFAIFHTAMSSYILS